MWTLGIDWTPFGKMIATVFLLAFLGLFIGISCGGGVVTEERSAELEQQKRKGEELVRTVVMIGTVSVSVPVGRFFLIRKGGDLCAVRFTEFHRELTRPMPWSPPMDSQYAQYDWFYQGDGSEDFTKPNIESGHRNLYMKPTGIFHPFEAVGDTAVRCGPFRLAWDYPTWVGFHLTNRKEDDVGNEIAPTKWKELSEVNVKDPRLKWYRYDETRQSIRIPIDQLW